MEKKYLGKITHVSFGLGGYQIEGHPCPDSAYMVPIDLYYEVERL